MQYFIDKVKVLLARVRLSCLDKDFKIVIEYDKKHMASAFNYDIEPRVFIKITCITVCRKTRRAWVQHGRKWYLSDHMTDDEIVKTAFGAYERFISHEAAEGFFVDGLPLFNPHTDFEEMLKICNKEVKRT